MITLELILASVGAFETYNVTQFHTTSGLCSFNFILVSEGKVSREGKKEKKKNRNMGRGGTEGGGERGAQLKDWPQLPPR